MYTRGAAECVFSQLASVLQPLAYAFRAYALKTAEHGAKSSNQKFARAGSARRERVACSGRCARRSPGSALPRLMVAEAAVRAVDVARARLADAVAAPPARPCSSSRRAPSSGRRRMDARAQRRSVQNIRAPSASRLGDLARKATTPSSSRRWRRRGEDEFHAAARRARPGPGRGRRRSRRAASRPTSAVVAAVRVVLVVGHVVARVVAD